jgi:hypothetical protein
MWKGLPGRGNPEGLFYLGLEKGVKFDGKANWNGRKEGNLGPS